MSNDPHPRRHSARLPGYDYSQAGAYFITACTQNRVMLFGEVIDGDVRLNEMGTIVQQTWDDLPAHYNGIPGNRARLQDVLGAMPLAP